MPTARTSSAAVHIPEWGVLVLGGVEASYKRLQVAELLQSERSGDEYAYSWCTINPMQVARYSPSAVYFNNRVFVVSHRENKFESLSLTSPKSSQWTILHDCPVPDDYKLFMCVFNGRILLSCRLNCSELPIDNIFL